MRSPLPGFQGNSSEVLHPDSEINYQRIGVLRTGMAFGLRPVKVIQCVHEKTFAETECGFVVVVFS